MNRTPWGWMWLVCVWWGLLSASVWAQDSAEPQGAKPLRIYSRTITTMAADLWGNSPEERADAARERIEQLFKDHPDAPITSVRDSYGVAILVDGKRVFHILQKDVDMLTGETLEQRTQSVLEALELTRQDLKALNDPAAMARVAVVVVLATALAVLALKLLWRVRRRVLRRVRHWVHPTVRLVGVMAGRKVRIAVRWAYYTTAMVFVLLGLTLVHAWLSVVLHQIPQTRAWSAELNAMLLEFAQRSMWAVLERLPNLLTAAAILLAARYICRLVAYFLGRVERGELVLAQLDRDTAATTRRLVVFAIWVFALAMAYPYLPGAQTQAFQGLTVMIGLMVSLGASSLVGQFVSGLILIYSRAFKIGEYVQIGDVEGTVAQIGLFATKVHTNLREEVSIPNSRLVGEHVKNYSRLVSGGGVMITLPVTAGYDVPWRQVETMLQEAAHETPGVLSYPIPSVVQRSLSATWVEYGLCVAISQPHQRGQIISLLYGRVQDVFARHGVDMLSPHFIVQMPSSTTPVAADAAMPTAPASDPLPAPAPAPVSAQTGSSVKTAT